MKWNNHKQLVRKIIEGKYSINPWTLIWANDRKLLVTFCAVKSNVLLGWLIGLGRVEVRFVYTKKIYNVF